MICTYAIINNNNRTLSHCMGTIMNKMTHKESNVILEFWVCLNYQIKFELDLWKNKSKKAIIFNA